MPMPEARYVIAGKDLKTGVPGSDSADSDQYFELGWEVSTTYLQIAYGRKTGTFTDKDIIVTASGREFLYTSSFSTVIPYREFWERRIDPAPVVDLVRSTNDLYFGDTWLRKLRLRRLYLKWFHFWRYRMRYSRVLRDLPMDASSERLPITDDFVCICIRFRDHQPQRNLPAEYLRSLLDALSDKRCYLVGFGAERLVSHPLHRVCSLAEFATLVRHPRCTAVIGTMTGPVQLAQMIHPNRLVVIDLADHYRQWSRLVPSVLSDLCNFARGRHSVYNYLPSVPQLLDDLATPLPESRVTAESYRQDRRFFDGEVRKGHAFFEHDRSESIARV